MYLLSHFRYTDRLKTVLIVYRETLQMARPQIPERLVEEVEQLYEQHYGYPAGVFQEALRTVTNLAAASVESSKDEGEREGSIEDVYSTLAAVEEDGLIYTLRRPTPLTVEYLELDSSASGGSKAMVYVRGRNGKRYRLVADLETDSFSIEHRRSDEWRDYRPIDHFEYRSPSHPEAGEKRMEYSEKNA